jgi:hypothetical protein
VSNDAVLSVKWRVQQLAGKQKSARWLSVPESDSEASRSFEVRIAVPYAPY